MDFEGVIALLQSIKGFRVNDELPFNTVDYLTIDDAIEFLAAQHGVQADGAYCVCPQSLIPVVGNAPTECPYCHQPRR